MVGLVFVAGPALARAPPAGAAAGPGGQRVADLARGWPGLHQQLQADHVLPGSALAKLIAENQDLGLLRPEEAADSLKLPPWLRVLWRKHHPDGRYLASDPTGGATPPPPTPPQWAITHPGPPPGHAPPPRAPAPATQNADTGGAPRHTRAA